MYQIIFLKEALEDLKNIIIYINNVLKSPKSAKKLQININKCLDNIIMFPYGESIIYLDRNLKYEYRIAKTNNYLIIYTIDEIKHLIYIVRIIYNKIDYYNMLE